MMERIKKKIYISGRMSGLTRAEQRERFMKAEAELREAGFRVCNPIRTPYWRWPWLYRLMGYHLCLCIDLWMLSQCDGIYLFSRDWTMSRGACIEQAYAHMFGLDVYRNAHDLKPKPMPYERERELPDDRTVEQGDATKLSFDEKCELIRRTALNSDMTYEERLAMQRRRYGL